MGTDFLGNSLNNFRIQKTALSEAGEETGTVYNYYGYIHRNGKIIIMRGKNDETEYKYADGAFGDFDSVWTLRQSLTYVYWNEL